MDGEHRNGLSTGLKRHRDPLSDSEDNVPLSFDEVSDVQKRRRLEAFGEENVTPEKRSSSGTRLGFAEFEVKPDTPAICSIRSRVQQLTQRRGGGPVLAQRCLSDPGSGSGLPSFIIQDGFKEHHLIGEAEFSSRVERFKAPITPQTSPLPANRCPRTLSNAVTNLQMKLEASDTPSSKQVSRIRQEREEELRLLRKPITENVFLKRSLSDTSLTERATSPFSSSSPRMMVRRCRRLQWPPFQPWKQADANVSGDEPVEVRDGSFTTVFARSEVQGEEPPIQDTEAELDSHDETNTAEMIDLMFDEVLDAAAQRRMEEDGDEEEGAEDHDSGIATVMDRKEKTDAEFDMEKAEGDDVKETEVLESSANEELLTFPSSCILSPLSKSVEAVVTPMRLAASQPANPPFLSPEEPTSPTPDSVPLYSIDAYRTLTQSSKPATHSVTPGLLRNVAEKSQPKPSINTKERIQVLNEEAAKLQVIINQTLHALSCCTDEEHGRGSLEEAEAEKLLLVSCEKREALLSEVARLKDSGSSVSELEEGDGEQESPPSQQPCRGTISISRVQLPLKVEFVCSARTRTGRPTHYFFVLIRYGPCNIVATPLATAADAQNGDTISFPTSITLQDIRSNFEIDVEIYSLSQASGNTGSVDLRRSTKSRSTPMKLLSTRKRTNQSGTSSNMAALNTRRTSNFCLVGCHKITLASLGQNKFPLDKVPFLSPLEGNIYLQLESQSHSNVQHQGFLTMFEVVNGFGAWHRRFFVLEGNHLSYWNHPNDRGSKPAESCVSLSSSFSQSVKPVKRDSCARPYTFELVSSSQTEQQDDQAKGWFSADTREDLGDWMEKLNQVLLDLNTWTRCSLNHAGAQTKTSSCKIRESSL
ncbi:anillin isoform X2 [Esox lucius]|uniref:PH domain-containing protein n=1 Tax=Esox lucius TaxID=8010 RepID=A0A3P8ZXY6_ESOLU|nr:anillin isoform X2 [Esox lucius]